MWPCDYVLTNRVQISLPWQLQAYSPGPLSPSIHPPSSCWNSVCWPGSDSEAHTLEGWHGKLGRVCAPGKFVRTAARPGLGRTLVNSSHWTLMNLKHNYRGALSLSQPLNITLYLVVQDCLPSGQSPHFLTSVFLQNLSYLRSRCLFPQSEPKKSIQRCPHSLSLFDSPTRLILLHAHITCL